MARARFAPRTIIALAAVVATVATAGSLTYSLGMGLYPCHLCWYQRILTYPLVLVLTYAYATADTGVWRLVLPFSVLDCCIAAYQSWLQVSGTNCGFGGGCAAIQFHLPVLGLTIPNQSLLAGVLVTALMVWLAYTTRAE